MRRRWILVSVLAAVVALGIGGGAVLAQSADTDGRSPIRGFVSRVAEVLGIEETKVQEAFDQAASDMKEEVVQAKLDAMEESGKVTPEQREEWEKWIESMPDGLLHGSKGPGFRAYMFKRGGPHSHDGMTEEQREEWKEWIESMPEGLFHGSRGPFRMFRFNKHRFEAAPPPSSSGDAA